MNYATIRHHRIDRFTRIEPIDRQTLTIVSDMRPESFDAHVTPYIHLVIRVGGLVVARGTRGRFVPRVADFRLAVRSSMCGFDPGDSHHDVTQLRVRSTWGVARRIACAGTATLSPFRNLKKPAA